MIVTLQLWKRELFEWHSHWQMKKKFLAVYGLGITFKYVKIVFLDSWILIFLVFSQYAHFFCSWTALKFACVVNITKSKQEERRRYTGDRKSDDYYCGAGGTQFCGLYVPCCVIIIVCIVPHYIYLYIPAYVSFVWQK